MNRITPEEFILNLPKTSLSSIPLEPSSNENGDANIMVGFYGAHEFQRHMVTRMSGSGERILNAACADDPAGLGQLGAVNLDVQVKEKHTGKDFSENKGFVEGSVFSIPFGDGEFDVVVLGEFLEHCTKERALDAVSECRRVLKSGGRMIMTVPLDARPASEQREYPGGEYQPFEYVPGVTCHHQTWWSNQMLRELRRQSRMVELCRCTLLYILTAPIGGWGLVWEKP